MYAQCPECLTIYKLDAATLAQAHGTVGCGQCGATFNALPTLTEQLPDEPFENLLVHASSPAPPILMMAVVRDEPPQQTLFKPVPAAQDHIETAETGADEEPPDPLPSFVMRPRRGPAPPRRTGRWIAACVVLTLCLGVQLAWAKRKALTANPATRPWLAQACELFGCTLPPVRDLARLQLLSRDVRPHPNVPDALLISATVRNNAPFTQPYPVVSITLSDLDENRIAMRRFRPSEYIADPKVRAAGLAPGATAALMFEVKDPGRHAVAFQFGFE